MAQSTPERLALEDNGLERCMPSALFRGDSLDKIHSPIRDVTCGSNLNPFRPIHCPLSPGLAKPDKNALLYSPQRDNNTADECGVSDEDTLLTAVYDVDDDSFDTSSAPSSPVCTISSTVTRKRTSSSRKEDSNQLTNTGFGVYRSIQSPLFSPPVLRKDGVFNTNFKTFRQGGIESAMSFDSHDSSCSRSPNTSLSPLPQCISALGIGSDSGFPARIGQFSFSRSPIEEMSHLERGSPYHENDGDASMICATKIRRLNLDYDRGDYQSRDIKTDTPLQFAREEQQKVIRPTKSEQHINFYSTHVHQLEKDVISPTDVASYDKIKENFPLFPPVSAFSSPPVTKRKGLDSLTPPPHQKMSPCKEETPIAIPTLKRKGRSPIFSHNDHVQKPVAVREEVSRLMQDFETIGTLGDGSFGTVYECISRVDGCPYAVKATKCQAKGKADRDRMLKEVYALAALSNLTDTAAFHIVGYHQAWMEENRLYIQTELCTSTLVDEMKDGGALWYDTSRQFKVLREMLLALDLIHRNGMVHLDIKPDNIFVKNDKFKLGDFGLVAKSSVSGDVEEGDSRYMCNDLLQGNHTDLTKCDIFSLGATMYEIALQRTLPTHGEEWHQIRAGILEPLSHISKELFDIIKIMIHSKREQRPSAAMLLRRRQLLSEDQKQLILARNKVREANEALAVKDARLKALQGPVRTTLTRANTLG